MWKYRKNKLKVERGMDVGLVLLMYDPLQTVKLQLQLQVGLLRLRRVPKFVLQFKDVNRTHDGN